MNKTESEAEFRPSTPMPQLQPVSGLTDAMDPRPDQRGFFRALA